MCICVYVYMCILIYKRYLLKTIKLFKITIKKYYTLTFNLQAHGKYVSFIHVCVLNCP